jgi:Xaa-Pro aminopeptidase
MIDIAKIQRALQDQQIDAWLLYDFRRQNLIALDLVGHSDALMTRRWYYLIPAHGEPVGVHHTMEPNSVGHLPGRKLAYHSRATLTLHLGTLLRGVPTVAMEYSPNGAIPVVSRVDQGAIELIQSFGPKVVSSARLIQDFLAVLTTDQIASHRRAAEKVLRIKDEALAHAADAVRAGTVITEYDIQQFIADRLRDYGLETDHDANASVNGNAGKPHYSPTRDESQPIRDGDFLLLDLWGKEPGGVYADITWTGFLGEYVPDEIAAVFDVVARARDSAVAAIQDAYSAGRTITGADADNAARRVIETAAYGDRFIHRTGHSITGTLHGPGANLDDFETHDDRPLVAGLLFSVEPGIYLEHFGVRSEINVLTTATGPEVTTLPLQSEVLPLLKR